MASIRIIRHLRKLQDVDDTGIAPGDVPTWDGSSFTMGAGGVGTGGGSFSLGVSNLGNTLGETGITGTRLVLAGIGNITLSQLTGAQGGTISISGGTVAAGAAFSAGVSGGNTAGDTGATGTRLVFAGGNNVTLSQATDANGGSITIAGPNTSAQSAQTQNLFDLTISGNTDGAPQLVSSGTLTLAGGTNITLSQNGNAISIIGAAGGGGTQTAISGIAASNTTYTSGTVTITGVGGGVTVSSNTGQRIDISVAAPVAQTNQAGSVYAVGNTTSSSSGTYDARTLSLRGDGIISIAATNSGFRISASQSVQSQNVHNVTLSGNTAGAMAQVSSGTLTLAGGNGITLSQAGNAVTISGITQSVQTQDLRAVTISGNTAGALAGISSGTMTIAGGNNITVSQAGNAITISGANIGGAQTGISGIANSQTTYTSGTVSLSELGAITIRSTTGNQFQLSVNAQSVQPETQTFLGALAASNTTYTSGTVTITGVGGGVTVSSNTGQRIDISVAAPVAQTNQAGSLYAIGNTTSSSSGTYDARTLSLSGAGIISIAATNSGFKISATQSNQAGSLYAIGNTTSSSSGTYDARTLSLSGAGIISIAATNSGFKISASESVQTQNLHNLTLSGNTAGAMAQVSSGTLTLAGGNNITLSQAGNAVTISGANIGGAQTGISSIAASNATYTSGQVEFTGSGIVTVRSSAGQRVVIDASQSVQVETQTFLGGLIGSDKTYTSGTITLSGVGGGITVNSNAGQRIDLSVAAPVAQTVQTQNMVAVTLSGNTSGAQALISSGTMTIAGGNNITVSQAGNAVTISGPNIGGAQTGISGIANSQTTFTSGTVSLSELGAITIRSTTGNQFQLSVNAQSVQPETQTFVGGLANSQTTYTSGTVSLSELGAITIRSTTGNQFQLSVNAQSVQPETQTFVAGIAGSNTTYSSGTISITGVGGGVTVSSNTGQRIDISVAAPVAQTVESQSIGMSNLGNTSGTTGIASGGQVRFLLVGGNNVTLSQSLNGASGTLTISAFNQTVQTQNQVNVTLSGNTAGAMAHISSGTMTLAGGNNVTLSQAGNAVTISGPNTVAQTNQAGSLFAVGNTTSSSSGTYDARTVSLRGDGIISIAATNSGFRISATESVQTQNLHNVTLSGNTSGAMAHISSGTMTLAGGNNVTLSQAGNAVTISAASQTVQTQNMVAVTLSGNTSGAQALVSSGTLTLAGGNNITVSQAGNAVTISGPNVGGAQTGISGLANSETTYTSGSVTFSALGAITIRSTTGQHFQFSVNSQTAQTLGMYAVQNTTGQSSSTTMDARTISIAGDGAVSAGYSAGSLRISAPPMSVLSAVAPLSTSSAGSTVSILGPAQFSGGLSNIGNTIGDTGAVTARVVLAGGNGITLSGSTNAGSQTITISAAAQTNQAGSVYAVGNTTSSSSGTYDARTLSLRGDGIISIAATNSGFRISATESVQTQNLHNVTLSGNTAGAMAHISSGTMTLAGGNGITLSQAGNAVTISGGAGGAAFSAGVSTGGNTAGNTGISGTQMVLAGMGAMSLSQTTGANGNTVSILAPASSLLSAVAPLSTATAGSTISILGPAQLSVGFSTPGNTSGNTGFVTGRLALVGSNGITLSGSTNADSQTITISGITQTLQTSNVHNVTLSGNTAGAMAQISSGTMTLAGGNGITLSQAGNAVTISGGGGGAGFSAGVSTGGNTAGATGISGSQMVLVGSGVVSLSQTTGANGNTVSLLAPAQSALSAVSPMSLSTNGSTISVLGPDVSLISAVAPLSTTTNGSTISILGPAQLSVGFSTPGNTLGNTGFVTGRLALVGSNGITLSGSTNAGSQTITISGITQSAQPGIQHLVVSNTTFSSGTVSLSGFGDVTVNTAANLIRISAPVQTVESLSIGMSNIGNTSGTTGVASGGSSLRFLFAGGNNITLSQSINGASGTITISAFTQTVQTANLHNVTLSGNTAGAMAHISSGTMTLAGGNNITLSQAGNAVTISGGAGGGFSAGLSNLGNSQGDTGVTGTRLVLVGTNNITLSQSTDGNGATVRISGQSPAGGQFSAGVSNLGNTAGATGITGTQLVWVGSGAMSLSQTTGANGGTVSILGPATSSLVGAGGISVSTNGSTISIMQATGSAFLTSLAPYDESPMVVGSHGNGTLHLIPVRVPEGVQFDRIGLAMQILNTSNSSNSITLSQWVGFYTRTLSSISLYGSTSISTNYTGSGTVGSYSLYGGNRWHTIPWTSTLPEGDYYIGIVTRSTTGGGAGHTISQLLLSKYTNSSWSGVIGLASNASDQRLLGQGYYSATTSSLPASIAFTQIQGQSSNVLRAPIWMLRSGTV